MQMKATRDGRYRQLTKQLAELATDRSIGRKIWAYVAEDGRRLNDTRCSVACCRLSFVVRRNEYVMRSLDERTADSQPMAWSVGWSRV